MPPKRRVERENDNNKMLRMEQMPTDHELFLQAFEKPTQIYRYLRTRSLYSPCFLTRTLTYMRHRVSRKHKRNGFKVDSLYTRLISKKEDSSHQRKSGYLNLTFTGFHDKLHRGASNTDTVLVETILLKLCHKKRKDVTPPVIQITVGHSHVARNPDAGNPPTTAPAISVPSTSFHFNNGHLVKSYVLLFRVSIVPSLGTATATSNGVCNGTHSDLDEPPAKRQKNGRSNVEEEKVFGAELMIFNKQQTCLLTNGDYELLLQEVMMSKNSCKKSSWETLDDAEKVAIGVLSDDDHFHTSCVANNGMFASCLGLKAPYPFDMFEWGPTLRFTLHWSDTLVNGTVPRPGYGLPAAVPTPQPYGHRQRTQNHTNNYSRGVDCGRHDGPEKRKKPKIFYQFLYNNNTRQQTEAREDFCCPWCSLDCARLYSLLKHLKLCHSRFLFTYNHHPKGARIDVAINECYDGSYSGNPHDLHSCPPGLAFSRNGPVRRTPVTSVTVCHPKRPPPSLSEFLEADDSEYDGVRPYIAGHNRLYHHSGTCLPVRPQEIDLDSEAENDPEWLRIKTKHMIDEFTDVNEGEKELMKLWNLHVMKYGFVGDCQIPLACRMFVEQHGREVLRRNLYRNFVLHMCNLLDFGLIGAGAFYQIVLQLRVMKASQNEDEKEEDGHVESDPVPPRGPNSQARLTGYAVMRDEPR